MSAGSPDKVGEYVPFYFCSRSVMLYVVSQANDPDLTYRGGQGPIVHLEADLHTVVARADAAQRRWAVSLSNAGSAYAQFRTGLVALEEIGWDRGGRAPPAGRAGPDGWRGMCTPAPWPPTIRTRSPIKSALGLLGLVGAALLGNTKWAWLGGLFAGGCAFV
ncbi:DarT ssDNA thymidine ADP-ribosyltransferase family protein, partial [Phenylobacterium sp.]|uniref:DarT ssDNA thymidine ADP-ribosyltransferase family protein n=1 Tax=Phenylobacterium sp. TaxID=1871053 RepID=UPI0034557D15